MNKIWLALLAISLASCDGFFGNRTDLEFIEVPEYTNREVAYVPILPIMDQFVEPTDVVAGYDELIYVADAGTDEIIALDQSGRELSRKFIPNLSRLAMDRALNLLAIGTVDTTINGTNYTLSAIYRINQIGLSGYGLSNAVAKAVVVNPFYFKTSFSAADAEVMFTAVDAMGDNWYYVCRSGPRENKNQVGGPDDALLLFNSRDQYVSNVFISTGTGLFSDYFKKPLAITTWAKPPQSNAVDDSRHFFTAMNDPAVPIKVQSFRFNESDFGSSFEVEQLDYSDTAKAEDFLYRPGRFSSPTDLWLGGDQSNFLFVVDEGSDSLYQFTTSGFEGINPPAGSSSSKNIVASFGGRGLGATQFNNPSAVTYLNEVVYVADRGNGRVLRFKLTTDFD